MSRSFKRVAVCGNTLAKSEKQDKRIANRKIRRCTNQKIANGDTDIPESKNEHSNVWDMAKDGKQKFDKYVYPKYLRK